MLEYSYLNGQYHLTWITYKRQNKFTVWMSIFLFGEELMIL